jgi:hypothetical protein
MRATDGKEINPATNPEAVEAMAKYGITRVPVDYFHYKEFRYTNLDDAIAEATRQKGRQGSRREVGRSNSQTGLAQTAPFRTRL